MSVSMVAVAWRRLSQAARWNGHAPQVTTGAARVRDSHCQASNCSAGTIARRTTGTVSTRRDEEPGAQGGGLVGVRPRAAGATRRVARAAVRV